MNMWIKLSLSSSSRSRGGGGGGDIVILICSSFDGNPLSYDRRHVL